MSDTMRAAFFEHYGPPETVQMKEIPVPELKDDSVLIQVRAASLNPIDLGLLRGKPYFVRIMAAAFKLKTNVTGRDVAGIVEAVGKDVTRFKIGDEVFGVCAAACADYSGAREVKLAHKPRALSFEEAAAIPIAGLTALQAIQEYGCLQPGQKVLINGASGGVGSFAVQIAKALGGVVTAVCSTRNVDTARRSGADEVVDYKQKDFVKSGQRYDLIVDIAASRPLSDLRKVATPQGTIVVAGAPRKASTLQIIGCMFKPRFANWFGKQKFVTFMTQVKVTDLEVLAEMAVDGRIKPYIERTYPLSDTAEGLAYLEQGHAMGKLVVTMDLRSNSPRDKNDAARSPGKLV